MGQERGRLISALVKVAKVHGWQVVHVDSRLGWLTMTLRTDDEAEPEEK